MGDLCFAGQVIIGLTLFMEGLKYGIDCYFLVFMGLFALNLPCTHQEIRD
eukprot:SAG31_NODE_1253_length_9089_cov_17.716765_6_plen_50_part_00